MGSKLLIERLCQLGCSVRRLKKHVTRTSGSSGSPFQENALAEINEDLLWRLMCSSDPIISDLRTSHHPKKEEFPDGVLELPKEVPVNNFV